MYTGLLLSTLNDLRRVHSEIECRIEDSSSDICKNYQYKLMVILQAHVHVCTADTIDIMTMHCSIFPLYNVIHLTTEISVNTSTGYMWYCGYSHLHGIKQQHKCNKILVCTLAISK